jgi:hypothetical protein
MLSILTFDSLSKKIFGKQCLEAFPFPGGLFFLRPFTWEAGFLLTIGAEGPAYMENYLPAC